MSGGALYGMPTAVAAEHHSVPRWRCRSLCARRNVRVWSAESTGLGTRSVHRERYDCRRCRGSRSRLAGSRTQPGLREDRQRSHHEGPRPSAKRHTTTYESERRGCITVMARRCHAAVTVTFRGWIDVLVRTSGLSRRRFFGAGFD